MENEDTKSEGTDDSTPQRRRKSGLKFSPKVLPKKAPKIIPKPEPQEENKALTIDKKLMTKLGSLQSTYGPGSGTKAEKQGTPVQVAFGRADPSIPRTFPTPRSFSSGTSAVKLPKEHNEPWGYTCTNGPVSLPLRRPNSGDTGSHVLLSYVFCGMMRGASLFFWYSLVFHCIRQKFLMAEPKMVN
jgi:DNA-directed RNA polymerase III subunit RPC4